MNRFILLIAAITVAASLPVVRAEISEVRIAVDGLACPFCVFGIEKHLKRIEGVEAVRIDLETGLAIAVMEENAVPDLAAFPEAVEKAGFTPREIKITAIGRVETRGQDVVLLLRGSTEVYVLFAGDSVSGPLTKELLEELSALANEEGVVAVSGTLHRHEESPDGLSVDAVSRLSAVSLSIEVHPRALLEAANGGAFTATLD